MATETHYQALAADLTALGRATPGPAPSEGLVAEVTARVADARTPVTTRLPERMFRALAAAVAGSRRRVAITVAVLMVVLVSTPPVRASVAEWFGFAGVIVRNDPTPGDSVAPSAPPAGDAQSLREAAELVEFDPLLPTALGVPEGVGVSDDRRVLSMSWPDAGELGGAGAVRLDQFDGRLDYAFAKTAPGVRFTSVGGAFALWFDEPHEVVVLDADGTRRTETARLAGHTLIWEDDGTTLRLEGELSMSRAREIARSVTPVD